MDKIRKYFDLLKIECWKAEDVRETNTAGVKARDSSEAIIKTHKGHTLNVQGIGLLRFSCFPQRGN